MRLMINQIVFSILVLVTGLAVAQSCSVAQDSAEKLPNIVYILADDLGYGELGCYGQKKIKTPNLDQLAREGIRFTQHYSGSPVCASSRCVLMTGKHTGHAYIRGNTEVGGWGPEFPEGQTPLLDKEITIAEVLNEKGYKSAAIGKWGLGGPGSVGHPNFQGFDLFYGYLCQRVAHNYYPTHLWWNHDVDILGNTYFRAHQKIKQAPESTDGWNKYSGKVYATDRMIDWAEKFIDENKAGPFFLYYPTVVPHVALQVPEDSLAQYEDQFEETPYLGTKGYTPHPKPRAAYAAMITRMDRNIGRILEKLKEHGLKDDTIVIFSSDNGPTYAGGVDFNFFESAGPLRGLKGSTFEGGLRVPMIARWPGKIKADSVTEHISAFQDVLPTLADIVGSEPPEQIDGLSFLPTLLGQTDKQQKHEYLYWELKQQQSVRAGKWKLYRKADKQGNIKQQLLFDLEADLAEKNDLAKSHSEQLQKMLTIAKEARTNSTEFPSPFDSDE